MLFRSSKAGTPEGLKLSITLSEEQIDFITKLDTVAKAAFLQTQPKAKWLEAVKGIDTVRVKVNLKGNWNLAKLTVVKDGQVSRGEGYDFLRSFGCRYTKASVKVVIKVQSIWSVKGQAGLSLEAAQLVLKPTEESAALADAFENDEELLAD